MVATCNTKSYNSRQQGEIYSALSEAGFLVYCQVLKEYSNFFIKFDTTTITLTPSIQVYTLPPDCTQIVSIAERENANQRWRQMGTESIEDALDSSQECGWWNGVGDGYGNSAYSYAGPYLPAQNTVNQPSTATGTGGYTGSGYQVQQIAVSPYITSTHMVEIVYIAKWIPIVNASSFVMLPDELTYAMQDYATAELLRANDDSLATMYEAKAEKAMSFALTWVRARQIQQSLQITPYDY